MNVDWWSFFREIRQGAWETVATIGRSFFEVLINMIFGGDPLQAILAIGFVIFFVYTSWRLIVKLFIRNAI